MSKQKPTHIGMVCFNRAGWVLLCNAKGKPDEWVLPKGHIEPEDKSSGATAEREVLEETGVMSTVDSGSPIETNEFDYAGEHLVITYYAGMAYRLCPTVVAERPYRWVSCERALEQLTFVDQRRVLRKALAMGEEDPIITPYADYGEQ